MIHRLALACCALAVFAGASTPAAAQTAPNPRIALVVGESTYADQTLATPANDAALVAQTLQAAGYDVVGARDLDEKSLRAAMRDFLAKAAAIGPDTQAFVYFSGRGVQYEGDNFLVPVDAQIARDSDVPIEAVRVADFTHALAAEPGQARIVVLDAARANPYAGQGSPLAGGLALVDPDPGVLIAFNASPGSVAAEEAGPYGVYAKTFAGAMREGGLPIDDVLAQTRVGVNQQTRGAQLPWSVSKLTAPYFVFERAADAPPPPAEAALADVAKRPLRSFSVDAAYAVAIQRDTLVGYQEFLAAYPTGLQAKRVRAILAARREALFWRRAVTQDNPRAYWTYLRRYPHGPHVADAERRLAILSARYEPPADFAPVDYDDLPPPPPDEYVYADQPVFVFGGPDFGPPPPPPPYGFVADEGDDWRRLPPPPPPVAVGVLPALAVAIPLIATARAYRDAGRHEGRAAPGAPPPVAQAPSPPPPLPGGVKPRPVPPAGATPTPIPTRTPLKGTNPAPTPAPLGTPKGLKPTPTPIPTPLATPEKGLKPTGAPTPLATPEKGPKPSPTPSATPARGLKPLPTPGPTPSPLATSPKVLKPVPTPTPTRELKPVAAPEPIPTPARTPKPAPEFKSAPPAVREPPPAARESLPQTGHAPPPPTLHAPAEREPEKKACGKPGEPPCPK